MRVLITGFEPFDGASLNPTEAMVQELRRHPPAPGEDALDLVTEVLPVDTVAAPPYLLEVLNAHRPEVVLMLGLASHRASFSVERVALNVLDFTIPDNAGQQVQDQPVVAGGPDAYFATLPTRAIVTALKEAGIPAQLSYTAGTYLCNQTLYTALHWAAQQSPASRVGFVHTPPLPEQVAAQRSPGASMALETMVVGVHVILSVLRSQGGKPPSYL